MHTILFRDPFAVSPNRVFKLTRDQKIYLYRQRKRGVTLRQLAKELNITPECVRQICRRIDMKIRSIKRLKQGRYDRLKQVKCK